MAVLPEVSPACREELKQAGFREGVAYMEVPSPLSQEERWAVATARMGGITLPHVVGQLLAIIDRLTGEAPS